MPSNPKLRDDHGTSWDTATYARTSTEQQKSCGAQQLLCRRLIDDRGWRMSFKLQDEGERGRQIERPGYKRLLELADEGRIQAIVVWKLDRLFRSLKEASAAEERLREAGVAIVSVTEPFDTTTAIGRFVFGFLANVAQFETELIRERALLGYERRTQAGKWTGPYPPYGYRKADEGRLELAEDEAELIATMHRQYKRQGGDRALAQWMNRQGMLRRGRRWTTDQVRKALTCPATTGNLTVRGITHYHEHLKIIEPTVFRRTARYRQGIQRRGKASGPTGREATINRIVDEYLGTLPDDATVSQPAS